MFRVLLAAGFAAVLAAQTAVYPLKDVRAGQRGVGKTVFSGNRVEEFQVEILGVLENIGPRQNVILARLKGGPLEQTGVMQGMSGSPVYIDGKLLGAVALAFAFAKEPVAGIRPFEEMQRADPGSSLARRFGQGERLLEEIATPISFSGFTAAAVDHFTPKFRELGLEPRQGVSAGGRPPERMGDPKSLQPGTMISVQLVSGDWSASADGTLTHIDGNRMWAFGHRFTAAGPTDLPFARAEVLTVLPNLSTSFKIASAKEWMGSIVEDRSAALAGIVGRRASTVPMSLRVNGQSYNMQLANDRTLTPLLVQMATFSAIDATERMLGGSTIYLNGEIEFRGAPPVRVANVFAGDFNVPLQVALGVASPLAYAVSSGFPALQLKGISLNVTSADRKKQLSIDHVWAPRQVRPGEDVEVHVTLAGEGGTEIARTIRYRVPIGAPEGPLFFTVSDGATSNVTEMQQRTSMPPVSAGEVVDFLNRLRSSTNAYLRIWRSDPGFQARGLDLPDLPPSMALVFSKQQTASYRGSTVSEIEIPAGDHVVTGTKTVQVEVKP
jgi:hypothetical protein